MLKLRSLRTRAYLVGFVFSVGLFSSQWVVADTNLEDLRAALVDLVGPRGATSEIIESPMPGVYQVDLGARVIFISQSGDHLLLGDVFDTKRHVSLAEEIKQVKVKGIIDTIKEEDMIVFSPENTKRQITVFTDVDCAYCRKLHKEVPTLVENGVKVRYVWFPRAGIGTPSYDKAVGVWCADNQQVAMDDAKLNNKFSEIKCEPNPVKSHYEIGHLVGVQGTPTIVLEDGSIIGGYLPSKQLIARLGLGLSQPTAALQN